MTSQKETLTKEQQDNVVRWIARGYEVDKVEFTNFTKNNSTGSYLLSIQINGDRNLGTVFSTYSLDDFNIQSGEIGLDPIEDFEPLLRHNPKNKNENVNIEEIEVIYLGE